jgi:MerR family transcriptional regulator, light-induced transcriptional regulator
VSGDATPDGVSGPTDARLTVAAVARRLGVAPATLRTWDRRYGLGPTLHTAGSHRRYSRADVARLEAMRRLVMDGVQPAEAARIAVEQATTAGTGQPPPRPPGELPRPTAGAAPPPVAAPSAAAAATVPARPPVAGGPGGRVLALPGASAEVRGLARAAMALDASTVRAALERAVRGLGVVAAWQDLLCPVLVAVGERWAATGEGVEVEHLLAEAATSVLRGVTNAPEPANGRPVLLAGTPGEQHTLPLSALAAALAEHGIGVRLLGGILPARALAAAVRRTGPAALLVWSHQVETADVTVLLRLPVLRPPVCVLAGGVGWVGQPLPPRVTYAPSLTTAVALIGRAVGA